MSREQAIEALRQLQATDYANIDCQHSAADTVLCDLLASLGYADVVAEYDKVEKAFG